MNGHRVKKLVGVAVSALMLLALVYFELHAPFEYRVQDAIFQQAGLTHPDIIVIGIDEAAWEMFGAWPWPRSVMAEAIDILNTYDDWRPAVIAIDVLYDQESHFFPEGDAALVDAVARAGNVVLGSSVLVGLDPSLLTLEPVIVSHHTPFDALLPYAPHGLVNGITDADGLIRNALLWEYFQGERLHSFPVEIAMMYLGVTEPHPFIQENPSMFLRFSGEPGIAGNPGDFFWYSFADIFEPWFDPGFLDGKIVLIGPYAIGMMDNHAVPILRGALMYGVEIHANAVQAILDEAFILRTPPWVGGLLIAALILLAMALAEWVDIRIAIPVFAVLGVGYWFAAQWIFTHHYFVLPLLGPPLALGIVAVYQFIYGYILQSYEKSKLRSTFKKYVDPKLVDALIESGEGDSDGVGAKKHIAVLFVDVRGFTPMTERLRETPELIVETLNEYLELTSASVFNNGGSVDKFIGDATMALFNGFVPLDDYIYKAVKAAWDIVEGAAAVNANIKEKYGIDIGFGVGVNCGDAIVGNLGPSFRKDYTAIGDTVNTAARLESNSKASQVLLGRDIVDILGDRIIAESVGEIPLKGKSVPLEVFALKGIR